MKPGMTLQEEYRAQREKLATGYGFGDFIDMFAAPTEPPVVLSVRVRREFLQNLRAVLSVGPDKAKSQTV